jgi:decaprenyl-phosphate phosphoribosyltransferase
MSEEAAPVTGPPRTLAGGIVKAVRPRQWVKNLLVLAAPLVALGDDRFTYDYRTVLVKVSIAFVAFCLAASTSRAWCPSGWPMGWRWCWEWRRWPSPGR